jgi:uncharacterized protein YjeT (DUF2065 family)
LADFGTAIALVLVIEGLLYAMFPEAMQRMMRSALEASPTLLRNGGLAAAVIGFGIVWLIRA